MSSNALGYLGLAKKAGSLAVGETNSGAAVRAGKGRVLLLASDASPNAKHRAEGFVNGTQTPLVVLPFTKGDLSEATGTGGCSMVAFTDVGLASVFMAALAEKEPSFMDTAQLLSERNEKALKRKREATVHRKKMSAGAPVRKAAQGKRRKKQ